MIWLGVDGTLTLIDNMMTDMTKSNLFLVGILLCLFVTSTSADPALSGHQYVYRDSVTNAFWSINTTKGTVTDGHSVISTRWCPEETVCIMGGLIQFGVVKNWQQKSEWTINDITFKKLDSREVNVLGKKTNAFLIRSTIQTVEFWYLMSPKEGLIAFGAKHPKNMGGHFEFWNETACGFGSAEDCD